MDLIPKRCSSSWCCHVSSGSGNHTIYYLLSTRGDILEVTAVKALRWACPSTPIPSTDTHTYMVGQLSSRTRHCVLAVATLDKSLSMV